jgi:hypothetical protein
VPARGDDPIRLIDRPAVVVDVLDDLVEEDHVEAVVVEGELFGRGHAQVRQPFAGASDLVRVDVDTVHVIAELTELRHVHAETAADVQDAFGAQLDVLSDERESAVLTATPDVTGMPEANRFRCRGSCHSVEILP